MKNEKSIAWGKGLLALSFLFLSMAYLSPAFAFSGGSLSNQACANCHDAGKPVISFAGLREVAAGSTNKFSVAVGDGPLETGGFNVWVDDGVLALISGQNTKLEDGEITHSSPGSNFGDPISWDFWWTAPTVEGSYDIMAQVVSATKGGGAGDDWGSTIFTPLSVQVVAAIPIPGAVFLFGSALGVLGWIRRRVS